MKCIYISLVHQGSQPTAPMLENPLWLSAAGIWHGWHSGDTLRGFCERVLAAH